MQGQFKAATKLFDLADVKRCELLVSSEAQEYINASHAQGRLLPQALQEHFGELEDVASVAIDVAPMQAVIPAHTDAEGLLLVVTIKHKYNDSKDIVFYVNAKDIRDLHPRANLPTVEARSVASELVKAYPHNK